MRGRFFRPDGPDMFFSVVGGCRGDVRDAPVLWSLDEETGGFAVERMVEPPSRFPPVPLFTWARAISCLKMKSRDLFSGVAGRCGRGPPLSSLLCPPRTLCKSKRGPPFYKDVEDYLSLEMFCVQKATNNKK